MISRLKSLGFMAVAGAGLVASVAVAAPASASVQATATSQAHQQSLSYTCVIANNVRYRSQPIEDPSTALGQVHRGQGYTLILWGGPNQAWANVNLWGGRENVWIRGDFLGTCG